MVVFHVKPTFAIYRINEFSEKRHGKSEYKFVFIASKGRSPRRSYFPWAPSKIERLSEKTTTTTNKQTNKTKTKNTLFIDAFFIYGRLTAVFTA